MGGAGQFIEGRDQGVIGAERDYGAHFLISFVFVVYGVYSEN
ncbi:putative membrane protein [Pseudomonas aeruginosa MH27]|nr:putative membrane protein [Pseudomonas aeruginosa MH27]